MVRLRYDLAGLIALCILPLGCDAALAEPLPQRVAQSLNSEDERPTGWYGSIAPAAVFGYPVNIESEAFEVEVDVPIVGPVSTQIDPIDISVDTGIGFGINGAVGYQFEDARVELEAGYDRNSVNSVSVNDLAEVSVDGSVSILSLAVNAYYDIPTNSAWRPYIGAGGGIAKLSANDVSIEVPFLGPATLDDSGIGAIFQVQAGVAYDFSEDTSAFAGYRLQGVPGTKFTVEGVDADADTVLIHAVQVGAQMRF